jgi:hypothetical protein
VGGRISDGVISFEELYAHIERRPELLHYIASSSVAFSGGGGTLIARHRHLFFCSNVPIVPRALCVAEMLIGFRLPFLRNAPSIDTEGCHVCLAVYTHGIRMAYLTRLMCVTGRGVE